MALIPDALANDDSDKLPRYLPFEEFSDFVPERQWLFGGKNTKFRIKDIYKGDIRKETSSSIAVSALTKMEQLLQNGGPRWTEKELSMIREYCNLPLALMKSEEQTRRDDLMCIIREKVNEIETSDSFVAFLMDHLFDSDAIEDDIDLFNEGHSSHILGSLKSDEVVMEEINKYLNPKTQHFSEYELKLFKVLFMRTDFREIEIKNVDNLPDELRYLFFEDDTLSLDPISRLLPMVQSVGFTDFKSDDMRQRCNEFINCIQSWIQTRKSSSRQIHHIEFRSQYCESRDDFSIEDSVKEYSGNVQGHYGWKLKYQWLNGHYHRIVAERSDKAKVQLLDDNVHLFQLSLDADPETLSEISVNEKKEAICSLMRECGLERLRFSVEIIDGDDVENEKENAVIKFKMTILDEENTLEQEGHDIERMMSYAEIQGKILHFESRLIAADSLIECTDESLAGRALKEEMTMIAAEKKRKEIRDPLQVMVSEAKKPWTDERQQNVLLLRKEAREQALRMMKEIKLDIESPLV